MANLLHGLSGLIAVAERNSATMDVDAFLGFAEDVSKVFEERLIELDIEMRAAAAYITLLLEQPEREPDHDAYPEGALKAVFAVAKKGAAVRRAADAAELAKTAARLAKAA